MGRDDLFLGLHIVCMSGGRSDQRISETNSWMIGNMIDRSMIETN